ncbi:hemerythrin domain-containing protein [Phytohalomonas tamaricis]|uniref:hemerythrin domain-containing protein n=1 Tax=Phytohalomonas tamaricis TaxID=2081032 RepID=UPI000D0BA110|nr:hemerythrin domain-containing protein [Phytohalomonas tamaricis]
MLTLTQLRQEHANMARLLHVLMLKQKTLVNGERPDFRLIREVVDYILGYMEDYIIPLETLCGDRLSARDDMSSSLVCRLADDYKNVKARLDRLSDNLDMVLMDAIIPMDLFADDMKEYLDAHRSYLRSEREELFPLIESEFDEHDYVTLRKALPPNAEQQLARLKEEYPQLYQEFKAVPASAA